MLTLRQFAEKGGFSVPAAQKWVCKGKIPGAVKVKKTERFWLWMVPDNAVRPVCGPPIQKKTKQAEVQSQFPEDEHGRQLQFVLDHNNTWSIRSIAVHLGITTNDVRELFEEILRREESPFECEEVV